MEALVQFRKEHPLHVPLPSQYMEALVQCRKEHPLHAPLPSQYMEALVQCRKDNRFSRYLGACNDVTFDLSLCLVKEKKVARADRQAK